MSTEQLTPVDSSDDLEAFSANFFGRNNAQPETTNSEEATEYVDEESNAPIETKSETHALEDDTLADEEDDAPEEAEQNGQPKKKSRFQERIDELTAKQREAERKLQDALTKLEQLSKDPDPNPKPETVAINRAGPTPDDLAEDGTEKYPLGEYDPGYIRDLARFSVKQEREEMLAEEKAQQERAKQETEIAIQQEEWNQKLQPAQERYPDFQEKGEELIRSFDGIVSDEYGQYITNTLMALDNGPDVLYYLANNLEEAKRIINSGPVKATIALGALEASFAEGVRGKPVARPKVSKAPPPPTHMNKGASAVVGDIPDDTDDLDAFEKKLFKKK